MKKIHHLVPCLAVLGMSACTTNSDTPAAAAPSADAVQLPVVVRQNVRAEASLQALFLGRLHPAANGCLRAGSDAGPVILWHYDTRIDRANGIVRLHSV